MRCRTCSRKGEQLVGNRKEEEKNMDKKRKVQKDPFMSTV